MNPTKWPLLNLDEIVERIRSDDAAIIWRLTGGGGLYADYLSWESTRANAMIKRMLSAPPAASRIIEYGLSRYFWYADRHGLSLATDVIFEIVTDALVGLDYARENEHNKYADQWNARVEATRRVQRVIEARNIRISAKLARERAREAARKLAQVCALVAFVRACLDAGALEFVIAICNKREKKVKTRLTASPTTANLKIGKKKKKQQQTIGE